MLGHGGRDVSYGGGDGVIPSGSHALAWEPASKHVFTQSIEA